MASTLFIVSITTHNKSLVKTIVRSAFRNFYPGISYCVQENEEYANIMLKTATKQCHLIMIILVKIIYIFYKIIKIFEK
jgi:hypothetical protein